MSYATVTDQTYTTTTLRFAQNTLDNQVGKMKDGIYQKSEDVLIPFSLQLQQL
jgi:hypothetical protein